MKMKSLNLTLVVLFLFSGCKLDETIYTSVDSATFIKTEKDATSQLYGVYSYFSAYNGYKSITTYPILFSGDDIVTAGGTAGAFPTRTLAASHSYFTGPWVTFYQTIDNANSLIKALQEVNNLSTAFKDRLTGEMYFLRAFSHFNLVRLYGAVPVRLEPVTGSSDFYSKRNSVEEVYALIFEDFKKAIELCVPYRQQDPSEFGRATKGAAQAMLSLAYLTFANYNDLNNKSGQEYYSLAKEMADAVITSNEYSLLPDYASLWDVNQEKNAYNEVIFGIQFTRDALTASANSRGSELAYYLQPGSRNGICGNVSNGVGASILKVQPWFYDECTTGEYMNDYRSEVSFLTRWTNTITGRKYVTYPLSKSDPADGVESYPYIDKYKDPKGLQARNNENDFFIMRLAEVYLIKAEAENEVNGPTIDAYQAFNKLRERARRANGIPRTTPADLQTGLTKEEFRLKIYKERGLELVGEGHRFFDNVRMRYTDNRRPMIQYRLEDFYPQLTPRTAPVYNATTNKWGGGRVNPVNIAIFNRKFLLWPIPSTEIDANPNTYQNADW